MKKEQYIKEVLLSLKVSRKIKRRIKEDLSARIDEALDDDPFFDIVSNMGAPKELASEFMENFEKLGEVHFGYIKPYEYTSKATLFGIPLLHINTSGSSSDSRVAKGIVALGDISIGVVSAGGVSIGVLSAGGVSLGAIAIGGVAIGGAAIGGVAIGAIAVGGVAISIVKGFGAIMLLLK